ncbi:unnamed protein product [Symbiodinium sp. CCMP2592]|nr:unnamed protein product [Symbiodinium sp. CCMP2592]
MHGFWAAGQFDDDEVLRTLGASALDVFQSRKLLHEQGIWTDESNVPPVPTDLAQEPLVNDACQGYSDQVEIAMDLLTTGPGVAPTHIEEDESGAVPGRCRRPDGGVKHMDRVHIPRGSI